VRWYVAYPISYRQLEEMMEERGVEVDHSTLNRWVIKYTPELDRQFRSCKCYSEWGPDADRHGKLLNLGAPAGSLCGTD
jgi:transposase-like protein